MTASGDRSLRSETVVDGVLYIAVQVLVFSISFAFRNMLRYLRLPAILLILGIIILFGLLSAYFFQLSEYLNHPSGEIGSRVLGIAAAGPIVMLLIHSLITARLAETVLGRKIVGPSFLGIRQWEWRLYVANLRLLLLSLVGFIVFLGLVFAIRLLKWPDEIERIADYLLVACLFWVFVRAWFFVLPMCIDGNENEILNRSWKRSARQPLLLMAVLLPLLAVVFLFQVGGERFLRALGAVSFHDVDTSLRANIVFLQTNLVALVVLIGGTYFFALTLITPARIEVYRRLKEG